MTLSDRLANRISTVPDFPLPGIAFQDLSPVYTDPDLFEELARTLADAFPTATHILAVEARGFALGAAVALAARKPLVFARKPGKLPGEIHTVGYGLEYGTDELTIQQKALGAHAHVVVIDDVLATGGTLIAAAELVKRSGARLAGFGVLVELIELGGREKLAPAEVFSVRAVKN
ncbi:MAG: adenine phosphoribosyltransferase [Corynebacteriales bacterium]|nr:adenine phosphoribosyltransferase [Mycobacteriales bacterium]